MAGGKGVDGQADKGDLWRSQPQEGPGDSLVRRGFQLCHFYPETVRTSQTNKITVSWIQLSKHVFSLLYLGKNSSLLWPTQIGLRAGVDQLQRISHRPVGKSRSISSSSACRPDHTSTMRKQQFIFSVIPAFTKKLPLRGPGLLAQQRDSPARKKSPLVRWPFVCQHWDSVQRYFTPFEILGEKLVGMVL